MTAIRLFFLCLCILVLAACAGSSDSGKAEIKRSGGQQNPAPQKNPLEDSKDPLNQMIKALLAGDTVTIRALLEQSVSENQKYLRGRLVHFAAQFSTPEALDLLIDHGAVLNVVDDLQGQTPLHLAVLHSAKENLEVMVQARANVNVHDKDGRTALMIAAEKDLEMLEILLTSRQVQINEVDNNQWTALMYASWSINSTPATVKLLLSKGADKNLRNQNLLTALQLAQTRLQRLSNSPQKDPTQIEHFKQIVNLLE